MCYNANAQVAAAQWQAEQTARLQAKQQAEEERRRQHPTKWEQEQQRRREAMQEMKLLWGDETFEFEARHCDMEMICSRSFCGLWQTRYMG